MSRKSSFGAALPTELPVLAVLGLSDPEDGDWARLRGLQYSSLSSATLARTSVQTAAALATVALLLGEIHLVAILVWLALVATSLWHARKVDLSLTDADRRRMSHDEVQRQTLSSIANALAWVGPVAAFGFFLEPQTQVKLWSVLAIKLLYFFSTTVWKRYGEFGRLSPSTYQLNSN